jgi:hypothetical protein
MSMKDHNKSRMIIFALFIAGCQEIGKDFKGGDPCQQTPQPAVTYRNITHSRP